MKIPYLDLRRLNALHASEVEEAMRRVLSSGRYLQGAENERFARAFAAFVGTRFCIPTSNGLDALTLIFEALMQLRGWAQGDEVILPAFTFVASAEAVRQAGLCPIFCDVTAEGLMDASLVERLVTPRTRALLPVYLYGKVCDMEALQAIAARHRLAIVEDAAQAHGATRGGRSAGSFGVAAGFSFYPGKNLGAMGDAGAVVTDDEELAARVRAIANYGASEKYYHRFRGRNARMDELQAAILSAKLAHLTEQNERRRTIARRYFAEIEHPQLRLPYSAMDEECVYHIFPIFAQRRAEWQQHLAARGIETLIHYPLPVHQQASFSAYASLSFPMAERLAATCLSLPLHPALREEEVDYIIQSINTA